MNVVTVTLAASVLPPSNSSQVSSPLLPHASLVDRPTRALSEIELHLSVAIINTLYMLRMARVIEEDTPPRVRETHAQPDCFAQGLLLDVLVHTSTVSKL